MPSSKNTSAILLAAAVFFILGLFVHSWMIQKNHAGVTKMVFDHATAWETGNEDLLASLLHDDVVFAYPGRRLNKEQTLEDLRFFRDAYADTKVYIHTIVIEGDTVAVEWQFATTKKETGKREVVSDAIIGTVRDGKFIVWKEYLDGRVKGLQAEGELPLEEGDEPFPWPLRPKTP